eukprot:1582109-Alexandrium_andersonii.AAC.1
MPPALGMRAPSRISSATVDSSCVAERRCSGAARIRAPACDSQMTEDAGCGPCPGSTARTRAGPNQPERRLSSAASPSRTGLRGRPRLK